MSEAALLGQVSLATTMLVATLTIVFGALGQLRQRPLHILLCKWGSYLSAALLGVSSAVLLHALLQQDRSLRYVWAHTDGSMNWFYTAAAFWGGQEGSLLFWAATLAASAALAVRLHPWPRAPMPLFASILAAMLLFFVALLIFFSNPFDTFDLIPAPADGRGLNPQLQTLAMMLHPPTLLLGYVLASVPAALLLAPLVQGRPPSTEELLAIRRWTLVAWLQLSIGLVLGMWWAYTELGWGGYWAWDPVENAALIPWLSMTAYLHVSAVQLQRGQLHRWGSVLLLSTWLLTVFGTFLTRSGFVSSIHAFARSEIGYYFLAFLAAVSLLFAALLAWRWKRLRVPRTADESLLSRENGLLVSSLVLVLISLVVMVGTLAPKLHEMAFGDELSLGAAWFNRWITPISLLLLSFTILGMLLSWRNTPAPRLLRSAKLPALLGLVVTASLPLAYLHWRVPSLDVEPTWLDLGYALAAVLLSAITTFVVFFELFSMWSRRKQSQPSISGLRHLLALPGANPRRVGGYLVHLGMAWMVFGFAGAAFHVEQQLPLRVGESTSVAGYELRLLGLREAFQRDKFQLFATVEVSEDGSPIAILEPARYTYYASRMATGETDLISTPLEDLYLNLLDFDPNEEVVLLLAVVSPFTWWLWVGSLVIMLGNLIGIAWPLRSGKLAEGTHPRSNPEDLLLRGGCPRASENQAKRNEEQDTRSEEVPRIPIPTAQSNGEKLDQDPEPQSASPASAQHEEQRS